MFFIIIAIFYFIRSNTNYHDCRTIFGSKIKLGHTSEMKYNSDAMSNMKNQKDPLSPSQDNTNRRSLQVNPSYTFNQAFPMQIFEDRKIWATCGLFYQNFVRFGSRTHFKF